MTYRIGRYALALGALMTLVGLVAGFGFMFAGRDEAAKLLLAAVPLGFVVLFTGIVMTLLGDPGVND